MSRSWGVPRVLGKVVAVAASPERWKCCCSLGVFQVVEGHWRCAREPVVSRGAEQVQPGHI